MPDLILEYGRTVKEAIVDTHGITGAHISEEWSQCRGDLVEPANRSFLPGYMVSWQEDGLAALYGVPKYYAQFVECFGKPVPLPVRFD
jgi:hypothetical protein